LAFGKDLVIVRAIRESDSCPGCTVKSALWEGKLWYRHSAWTSNHWFMPISFNPRKYCFQSVSRSLMVPQSIRQACTN